MISRLTDSVRDTSALQKRPELHQDALAARARVDDAHDQEKVLKTGESEMEKIRADVEGGAGNGYGAGGGSKKENDDQEGELNAGLPTAAERHFIDIMI